MSGALFPAGLSGHNQIIPLPKQDCAEHEGRDLGVFVVGEPVPDAETEGHQIDVQICFSTAMSTKSAPPTAMLKMTHLDKACSTGSTRNGNSI